MPGRGQLQLPAYVMTTDAIFDDLAPMLERLKIPQEAIAAASGVEERRFFRPEPPLWKAAPRPPSK